jgi:hypothetical protein
MKVQERDTPSPKIVVSINLAPPLAWGVAVISLIAAVAAMKLRQMLE